MSRSRRRRGQLCVRRMSIHSSMHACMTRCSKDGARCEYGQQIQAVQQRRGIRTFMHARMHVLPLECVPVHGIPQMLRAVRVRLYSYTCMHVVYTCKPCSTGVYAGCKRTLRVCARMHTHSFMPRHMPGTPSILPPSEHRGLLLPFISRSGRPCNIRPP